MGATYTWTLYQTIALNDAIGSYSNELLNASLTSDPRTLQTSVVFPAYTLSPGTLYNVSLTVVMVEIPVVRIMS